MRRWSSVSPEGRPAEAGQARRPTKGYGRRMAVAVKGSPGLRHGTASTGLCRPKSSGGLATTAGQTSRRPAGQASPSLPKAIKARAIAGGRATGCRCRQPVGTSCTEAKVGGRSAAPTRCQGLSAPTDEAKQEITEKQAAVRRRFAAVRAKRTPTKESPKPAKAKADGAGPAKKPTSGKGPKSYARREPACLSADAGSGRRCYGHAAAGLETAA